MAALVLSAWLVRRAHCIEDITLADAEGWLVGDAAPLISTCLNPVDDCLIRSQLSRLPMEEQLDDVLPYIMEVFDGAVVTKARDRGHAWQAKRKTGIFYTPTDVAEFIASSTLTAVRTDEPLCLDPACGTGIFLRSALDVLSRARSAPRVDVCLHNIFGIDISQQAVQSAAFVLLSRIMQDYDGQLTPLAILTAIRQHLVVADATLIAPKANMPGDVINGRTSISDLFPDAPDGFDVVIGNPPYSGHERDGHHPIRMNEFVSATKDHGPIYPLFIEMMWKFARTPSSAGGMVVPLSVSYNTGESYKALRSEMEKIAATWRCLFFDRTPDSLFGDDVKTRNAILLMKGSPPGSKEFHTSPLHRWNIRNRPSLFAEIPTVPLTDPRIVDYIPKIGTQIEEQCFTKLRTKRPIGLVWRPCRAMERTDISPKSLFHYSTAYNWLPVFRNIPECRNTSGETFIPDSLRGITCDSVADAQFTFAVLMSRASYWLWRVAGDGFHLTYRFLASLPFHPSNFSGFGRSALGDLGESLWSSMSDNRVYATNSGVTTCNFSPVGCEDILDRIDSVLIRELNLPASFAPWLRLMHETVVKAGRNN